ncbi:phosphate ABC transporter permease PstA [Microbacterium album]|uniref:Phosphate transport system permease protein PstA n=1 Tax=Microbacterium album TaxID=2053191 RepID=A0A917MNZ7_9MICO|nr:phosphate ABC transporter permease PstA [Microbacterium album]GGH51130.1 phosphate transport system permease protein PstA [Microbacterium album]
MTAPTIVTDPARRRATLPGKVSQTRVVGRDGRLHPTRPESRRNLSRVRREDVFRALGAAAAALATTWWATTQVLPWQGPIVFTLAAYALFLFFFVALILFDDDLTTVVDRVWAVVIHSAAVLLLLALSVVVVFTLFRGSDAFLRLNFWVNDLSSAGPLDPLTLGGMAHAALGTLIIISIALAISIPLGLLTAVMMSEFPSPFTRVVRTVCEAMTALPSIVCGLFIYATFILTFGFDRSGFAAALAVTIMILPIIIRSADVVLRLVPATLKEASYAMGASRWATVWRVVLPTSKSGLMTAIVLGTARGIGETAPVLLTSGYTPYLNTNPFSGPMTSLPLATFTLVKSPEVTQITRGFGAAAVLMVLVFILFLLARLIGGKGAGILSPRQLARVRRLSFHDLERFEARQAARALGTTGPAAPEPRPAPPGGTG